MDYACARMFFGEGKVGSNILYWEIMAKTKAVCTHRMVDDMIQMGLRWWRFEKTRDDTFGDPNIGNQDIKTHFLSFKCAFEDRKFMACSVHIGKHFVSHNVESCMCMHTVQLRGHGWFCEADGSQSLHVRRQNITTNFVYVQHGLWSHHNSSSSGNANRTDICG